MNCGYDLYPSDDEHEVNEQPKKYRIKAPSKKKPLAVVDLDYTLLDETQSSYPQASYFLQQLYSKFYVILWTNSSKSHLQKALDSFRFLYKFSHYQISNENRNQSMKYSVVDYDRRRVKCNQEKPILTATNIMKDCDDSQPTISIIIDDKLLNHIGYDYAYNPQQFKASNHCSINYIKLLKCITTETGIHFSNGAIRPKLFC